MVFCTASYIHHDHHHHHFFRRKLNINSIDNDNMADYREKLMVIKLVCVCVACSSVCLTAAAVHMDTRVSHAWPTPSLSTAT